jgi:hypothetical protein
VRHYGHEDMSITPTSRTSGSSIPQYLRRLSTVRTPCAAIYGDQTWLWGSIVMLTVEDVLNIKRRISPLECVPSANDARRRVDERAVHVK